MKAKELLAQMPWLRRLAQAIAGNRDGAADLVQETCIAALEHPPDSERPLRPWLRSVVRNTARMHARSDRRRTARDAEYGTSANPGDSPEDITARVEAQQHLTAALMKLAESYRNVIVLRYCDGLSAADIARGLDVPAGTVRWRIKHGLERLRALLEKDLGGPKSARTLVIGPLVLAGVSLQSTVANAATGQSGMVVSGSIAKIGVVLVAKKVLLAAVAVVAIGVGLGAWPQEKAPPSVAARPSVAAGPAEATALMATPNKKGPRKTPSHALGQRRMKEAVAARNRLATEIRKARETRLADTSVQRPAIAEPTDGVDGMLNDEAIRDTIAELQPLFTECFELALDEEPSLYGTILLDFVIVGEPEIGGVIEDGRIAEEGTTLVNATAHECMRQTLYAAQFKPPADGVKVHVSYPFVFDRDSVAGENEVGDPSNVDVVGPDLE